MTTQTTFPQGQAERARKTPDVEVEVDPLADITTYTGTPGDTSRAPGGLRAPLWRLTITSSFGHRVHPVLGTTRFHRGIDYGARFGTVVRAAASGTVVLANDLGPYGTLVVIAHAKDVHTAYGHLDAASVILGQAVRVGQRIGRVGITGLATGPHLHFEVRDHGIPVEPTPWLTYRPQTSVRGFDALTSKLPQFGRRTNGRSQPGVAAPRRCDVARVFKFPIVGGLRR